MECGDVEDINIEGASSVTKYPCKKCGAILEMIDEEDEDGSD
jgi:hypothetical protein